MSTPQAARRQESFTHAATIHMPYDITPFQRRLWNALLFHAWDGLNTEEQHCIALQDLACLIGDDSPDREALQEAAEALAHDTVLLARAYIEQDTFCYAFSPAFRQSLHSPSR